MEKNVLYKEVRIKKADKVFAFKDVELSMWENGAQIGVNADKVVDNIRTAIDMGISFSCGLGYCISFSFPTPWLVSADISDENNN